jgi:hypothetical protein
MIAVLVLFFKLIIISNYDCFYQKSLSRKIINRLKIILVKLHYYV